MSSEPGLFTDIALAERIERAERSLVEAGAVAAACREPRVCTVELGSGLAVWVGPGSPLDKVVGAGMGGDFDDGALDAAERAFAEQETPVQFEVSTLADPALVQQLTRRGYVLTGFENVLGRRLTPGPAARVSNGIAIETVAPADFDTWIDVVATAFATPDTQGVVSHEEHDRSAIADAITDMSSASGYSGSLARIGGVPVGGASLRLSDGIAQFCGAATLPEFRCRGVQGALLDARLATAAAAGCDLAVVTTLPGSKSQQNVQKLGFQLLYARAILVRTFETSS
ncbi:MULTISPECIES: GNAT family N-acetyltransferase [unclassified Nocardia]|uniref:GNAT family N-acetyltransferase n=1 Tax=unclassified Nocardia TaxID=2637762 RepID=UPI001CE3F2A6|nr:MULTISPECIES: GNAT family N-acetyltransferase [unclassified Nocardia]